MSKNRNGFLDIFKHFVTAHSVFSFGLKNHKVGFLMNYIIIICETVQRGFLYKDLIVAIR